MEAVPVEHTLERAATAITTAMESGRRTYDGEGEAAPREIVPGTGERVREWLGEERERAVTSHERYAATVIALDAGQTRVVNAPAKTTHTAVIALEGKAIERAALNGATRTSAVGTARIVIGTTPEREIDANEGKALLLVLWSRVRGRRGEHP